MSAGSSGGFKSPRLQQLMTLKALFSSKGIMLDKLGLLVNDSGSEEGLATLFPGAKSASQTSIILHLLIATTIFLHLLSALTRALQCMTLPGWGRSFVRGSNATVSVKGTKCPLAYYNSGGNSMGCQACPQGLTTRQEACTSFRDCGVLRWQLLSLSVKTLVPEH
eukprot:gene9035-9206_t